MKLRNIRKVLCIAAVSAAIALSGLPACTPASVVQAEETQFAGLDDTLRQMYQLYQSGDFASMYALDANDATRAYAELIRANGADRYIIDLDGNTKAMMYTTADGGYWWYFGQIENNLRHGTGTTVLVYDNTCESYNGGYSMDFPNGNGTYLYRQFNSNNEYSISGTFQGEHLNGTYQVNAAWIDENGAAHSSSLPITYTNSVLASVGGWEYSIGTEEEEDYIYHDFYTPSVGDILFYIDIDNIYSPAAVGLSSDGYSWLWGKSDISERFSPIFIGTAAASTPETATPAPEIPAPAPETTDPIPENTDPASETTNPAPETPAVPEQPSASGTYIVQRGDNLSRIADQVYGDRTQWRKIYDANKEVIRKDYIIFANQTLVIPSL